MDTATDIEQEVQTEQQQDPVPKMKVKDFAAKIKAKYPEYKDIDDKELTDKIIAKYPDYKDQIDFTVEVKKKPTSNDLPPISDNGLSSIPKPEVHETEEKDPITLSLQADELGRKVKSVGEYNPQTGSIPTTVPDEDAKKEAQLLKDEVKVRYGFDSNELANEHKGLTANDYGKEGFDKATLLTDKKENPELYQRKLGRLKWQSGLDSVLSDKLINGEITKETYDGLNHAINSSLQNASVGDYVQQRDNINYVANAIKQYGGQNADQLLKEYAVEVGKVYGNSYKSLSAKNKQETPESKYLNSDAELGLQYLKDIDPEKAQQYERLFIDPKTLKDKPDEQKGYNHLMQTLEETGLGLQENAVKEDYNNLVNISKRNNGLTPEQLEQGKVLETKKAEIEQKKSDLDAKYPDRLNDKVDDAMQEILGQKLGWGNYAGGMAGKAIKNTGQGIWEAVSEPFMSDASNKVRELAIMGESLQDNYVYHKTDTNKNYATDQLVIKPELQAQIDEITNDKSLTREQKEAKLYPLLRANKGDFGRVPIQGGKFNISPSSILYGLTDIGTQLLPFVGIEALTGGIGGAGAAVKFLRTFTAAAATGFHDEYANAISEGKSQSEAYKQAMGMTAISGAAMAGAGTAEKVRALYSGSNSSASKIIASMTDDEISDQLLLNSNKITKSLRGIYKFGERIIATKDMFAQGLKTGAEFEGAMALANEAKHQLYNTPIDREQNFKQSILGIANFGILGAGLGHIGYKSPTELQKSGFVEFGKNPEEFRLVAKQMQKNGQLTQEEFEHRNLLIDKSEEAYKTLPKANAKGKPLSEKDKADYIYNSVVKNEGKKAASTLPPKQAEKAEHTAMVADFKNDLILEPKTTDQLESRKNALNKILEPKKDENGKTIELNPTVEKEAKAELQAINEVQEENAVKVADENAKRLSQKSEPPITVEPQKIIPEPITIGNNEPTTGEVNKPLPSNEEQPTGQEAETGLPSSTEPNSEGGAKAAIPVLEGGDGGKEPPKVTPIYGEGKDSEDWTAIRKEKQREIKAVKDAYEKQGVKAWSETMQKGLEKTQKAHPEKTLYDAALTIMHQIRSGAGHGDLTTDEALATMQYLKRELGAKRSQLADAVTSDNDLVRQAAVMQDEALGRDYENAALAIKDITTTAGRTLNYAQSELRLDPDHGLQIRRMQLLRAKGGEKLTPEEMKFTKEKWDEEREIMKKEAEVREQAMKEDFDNRISELQKEHEQKLKDAGKTAPSKTAKEKSLSQKGKNIADKIRKLKKPKGGTYVDFTLGTWDIAMEGLAKLVEAGSTIAEAIEKLVKDGVIGFKEAKDRTDFENHIAKSLSDQKDKTEVLDEIKDFAKNNNTEDITSDMVSNGLIRDYVNSHIGEVENSKLFETAFEDLKKVLPDLTKEKLIEAYLKKGEFGPTTKKQLQGGIREQETQLKRIAKSELTSDQQQKIKLAAEKKNVLKKIKDFKQKLADGEFEEPAPVKLRKQDAELIRLKKQQSIIEEAYRKEQKKYQEQNKSKLERLADFARSVYVAILIGSPKTLLKVMSMSALRPMSEASTKLTLGKVFDTFFPNVSKAALRGGESSSIQSVQKGFEAYFRQMGDKKLESMYDNANNQYEAAKTAYNDYKNSSNPDVKKLDALKSKMNDKLIKAQSSFIYKFIGGSSLKDALKALVNRSNEIEKQFGKVEGESIKDGNWLDKTNYILGFIGRSHSAAKTFSGRFSFAAGFMARLEGAVRNGEDISSPDKVLEIAHESYLDWERGKYQQSNQISDLWNKLTNNISEGEKGSPREGTAKAMAALLKTEVAITRVPVNILHEAVMEYTLGAFRAIGMIAKNNKALRSELKGEGIIADSPEFKAALKEKISQMDEKQAATIARCFRKGGLGVGLYALALISGAIHFGIFPHLGQKKKKEEEDLKPNELNPGQIMVGNNKLGEVTSGIIEHIPALWPTFMGLGMSQAYQDEIDKGKSSKEAIGKAIYTHLKVIEGGIPQSKIISPSRVGETIMQTVKKKATDAGLLTKDEFQGINNTDIKQFVTNKKIKITPPSKKYTQNGEDKIMTDNEYEQYIANRGKRIEHDLALLKRNGLVSKITDNESVQREVYKIVSQAGEDARSEVLKKENKPKVNDAIKNYRPLPVHPIHQ